MSLLAKALLVDSPSCGTLCGTLEQPLAALFHFMRSYPRPVRNVSVSCSLAHSSYSYAHSYSYSCVLTSAQLRQ